MELRREPALLATTLLAPFAQMLVLFVGDMSPGSQAAWNGFAAAVAGLATAWQVRDDKLAPAILGFAQAVLSLLTVHGLHLTADQSTGVMAFIAMAVGTYVRTQVTPSGKHRREP